MIKFYSFSISTFLKDEFCSKVTFSSFINNEFHLFGTSNRLFFSVFKSSTNILDLNLNFEFVEVYGENNRYS